MNADDCCLANPMGPLGSMPQNICEGCHAPIDERVFLAVDNQFWHAACLRCDACCGDLQWDQSCFVYKGRVLCRADYQSLFVCPGCDRRLSGDDLVIRLAQTIVYHSQCLRCHTCGEVLHLGDTYTLLGERNVICAKHTTEPVPPTNVNVVPQICDEIAYANQQSAVMPTKRGTQGARKVKKPTKRSLKKTQLDKQFNQISSPDLPCLHQLLTQLQEVGGCTNANDDLTAHSTSVPGLPVENSRLFDLAGKADKSKGARSPKSRNAATNGTIRCKKRIRTSFKHNQLQAMKAYFELNQNPNSKDLRELSDETGLSKRVLQVWFQNARAKYRQWGSLADSLDADQCFTPFSQSDSPDATAHNTSDIEPIFASIRDIVPRNRGSDSPTSASTMKDWFSDRLQEWQQQQQQQQIKTSALQDSTHLREWIYGVSAEFQTTNLPLQMTS